MVSGTHIGVLMAAVVLALAAAGAAEAPAPAPGGPPARPAQVLPPQHWACRDLAALARAKMVTGKPAHFFAGGRSFTRLEVARILSDTVKRIKKDRAVPRDEDLERLQRLLAEFRPEVALCEGDGDLSWLAVRRIRDQLGRERLEAKRERGLTLHGSNAYKRTDRIEARTTGWSDSLVLKAAAGRASADATLGATGEDMETPPGLREGDLGSVARCTLERYALKAGQGPLEGTLGFTDGEAWHKGLGVSNLALEGADVTARSADGRQVDLAGGRTTAEPADRLAALHLRSPLGRALALHVQGAAGFYDPENARTRGKDRDLVGGLGLEATPREGLKLDAETAFLRAGGLALYAGLERALSDAVVLRLSGRRYRDLDFEYNAPPMYAGISGGDDTDDTGAALGCEAALPGGFGWTLTADSSHAPESGRLLFLGNECTLKRGPVTAGAGYEYEWTREYRNRIVTLRLGREFHGGRLKSSAEWTGERVNGEGSGTTRLSNALDLVPGVLTLTSSLGFKDAASGHGITQQWGLGWNVSAAGFFSLQCALASPDPRADSVEAGYLLRF